MRRTGLNLHAGSHDFGVTNVRGRPGYDLIAEATARPCTERPPGDPQLHPEPRLTPPIRSAGALVVCGDELNADLVLLRDPDLGVKGEGVANDAARPWSPCHQSTTPG